MARSKLTRTGLLLLLTAGPFLVFLFLFIFGKNRFTLDLYPISIPQTNLGKIRLVIPDEALANRSGQDQWSRAQMFFEKINSTPEVEFLKSDSSSSFWRFWLEKDTVLEIETAKGPSEKGLPNKPRLFLVDKQNRIRGVYTISNPLSMDTLMLEYSILINE